MSPVIAAFVEGTGTLACVLFSLYVNERASGKFSAPLDALFSSTLVCMGNINYRSCWPELITAFAFATTGNCYYPRPLHSYTRVSSSILVIYPFSCVHPDIQRRSHRSALNYTGGYYNPVLATSLKLGKYEFLISLPSSTLTLHVTKLWTNRNFQFFLSLIVSLMNI